MALDASLNFPVPFPVTLWQNLRACTRMWRISTCLPLEPLSRPSGPTPSLVQHSTASLVTSSRG